MRDEEILKFLGKKSKKFYREITKYNSYIDAANRMIMGRMNYNDHGVTHSKIVTRNSLEILELLKDEKSPNIIQEGIGDLEDVRIVLIGGSYLHDVGNAVHRVNQNLTSLVIAKDILEFELKKIYKNRFHQFLTDTLHCIFSHHEDVLCETVEAGIVTVSDGCDMEEGRARIPYHKGKIDIHSVSALSIKKVEILKGVKKPISIRIKMDDRAGIFQIQEVLGRKINTSGLRNYIEIRAIIEEEEIRVSI